MFLTAGHVLLCVPSDSNVIGMSDKISSGTNSLPWSDDLIAIPWQTFLSELIEFTKSDISAIDLPVISK